MLSGSETSTSSPSTGTAARRPTETTPAFIDEPGRIEESCRRWQQAEALAVDTEFVRERTFYPALGLIQISDGHENALVDPLRLEDLEPLRRLFADERIVKVFHSCGEDMEVLYQRFGEVPWPVFDTQIAAALSGLGYSMGLGNLVLQRFAVEIPKQARRTNWLRRPLTEVQKEYAALDVAYLLAIYDELRGVLEKSGRLAWAEEEFETFRDTGRFESDPEDAYFKIRRSRHLGRRQLAILRELAIWREKEARRRDLPRNFVLREAMLPVLARKRPRSFNALREVEGLRPDELHRHGRTILRLIRHALELPEDQLPPLPAPILDLTPYRQQVDQARRAVAETARELGVPAELLATRKSVERLVRRVVDGREPALPTELRGWRREVIGGRLLEITAPLSPNLPESQP